MWVKNKLTNKADDILCQRLKRHSELKYSLCVCVLAQASQVEYRQ